MLKFIRLHIFLFVSLLISSTAFFLTSKPSCSRVRVHEKVLSCRRGNRISHEYIFHGQRQREQYPTVLQMSEVNFFVDKIIPSTMLLTIFVLAMQRLSTMDTMVPEVTKDDSVFNTEQDDPQSVESQMKVKVNQRRIDSDPSSINTAKGDIYPDSNTLIDQNSTVVEQASTDITSSNRPLETQMPTSPNLSQPRRFVNPPSEEITTFTTFSSTTSGAATSQKIEALTTIKKNIANTLSGQREQLERLKATEPLEISTKNMWEDKSSQNTMTDMPSLITETKEVIAAVPTKRPLKKLVVKIIKKIIKPWKKWSTL